jgi:putative hemolysin
VTETTGFNLPAKRRCDTVAGPVLETLKHLPSPGHAAETGGWRCEVIDLDGRRIDRVSTNRISATLRAASRRSK